MTGYAKTATVQVGVVALPLSAWGLESMFGLPEAAALRCVGVVPSVAHAVPWASRHKPDVMLVDLDGEDGAHALADLSTQGSMKILALTSSSDTTVHDGAILAGARGVVDKRFDVQTLIKALHKVHDGEMWIDRNATSRIFLELARKQAAMRQDASASRLSTLTARERQAVDALVADPALPVKAIAEKLLISEHTLRNHLTSIYAKLGVANRTELYAVARRH